MRVYNKDTSKSLLKKRIRELFLSRSIKASKMLYNSYKKWGGKSTFSKIVKR